MRVGLVVCDVWRVFMMSSLCVADDVSVDLDPGVSGADGGLLCCPRGEVRPDRGQTRINNTLYACHVPQ